MFNRQRFPDLSAILSDGVVTVRWQLKVNPLTGRNPRVAPPKVLGYGLDFHEQYGYRIVPAQVQ
jgi:hypothetical protein